MMIKKNWRFIILIITILILIILEILTVFLISPLRLNQDLNNTIDFAHFMNMNMVYFRIILLIPIIWMVYAFFRNFKRPKKIIAGFLILLYLGIFYLTNYVAQVDTYFKDQNITKSVTADESVVPLESVVMGVSLNGESKAYPIDYLAFHHKVYDSVGGEPVLVTYCSICRSGRVFSPVIDGRSEKFGLVGLLQYNAVVQDESTSSWWQQATGEAIAGKKKGAKMDEYFSEQMSLGSWLIKNPNSLILQPDSTFAETYVEYEGFGTGYGEVNGREDESWENRSWIVGVVHDGDASAFDYRELTEKRLMQDFAGAIPVAVALEQDTVSIHVWDTRLDTLALSFEYKEENGNMVDVNTGSIWDMTGTCISGALEGEKLTEVQSYVEYWHSWKRFHPETKKIGNVENDN